MQGIVRRPRVDETLVTIAGPTMNFIIAFALIGLIKLLVVSGAASAHKLGDGVAETCMFTAYMSLGLCFFNLIPIPPLDGGRVAVGLLPRRSAIAFSRLEPVGIFLVLGALFLLPQIGIDLFGTIILPLADLLVGFIGFVTGHSV